MIRQKQKLLIEALCPNFKPPVYGSSGAAAFDIRTQYDFTLTNQLTEIKLGFSMAVPEGYVAIIAPRSGLGIKHGFNLRNTIGIIDSDYRGELRAMISLDYYNSIGKSIEFKKGDRIIQCMIVPVSQVEFELADTLPETNRGTGGFGSTGIE